jgi:hypothetical protein
MAAATATAIADVFPEDEPYAWDSMLENPDVQELLRDRERRGYERGRIDEARSVLYRVLASRSIAVTADERTRIHGEHDPARLEAWATNAVHAKTIGDIFRDG